MKQFPKFRAFTLIELLVVISIIAVLAGIALPVFGTVQERGAQTKALSNIKQIALACRIYAQDNNGLYPSYTLSAGKPTTNQVTDSNTAFAQLFPDYITNEQIFWEPKSGYGASAPDNKIDSPTPQNSSYTDTLKQGECSFAYVLGLGDTSNSGFPLIADAMADANAHTYTNTENKPGGVWKGKKAIVAFVDASAKILKVDQTTMKVKDTTQGGTSTQGNELFSTTDSNPTWLDATNNKVVNPK